MPYIKEEDKEDGLSNPGTAGELNFTFTEIIQNYLELNGLTYQHINDIVGALEGAKVEFQRRVVAPYEDIKIKENGDCYREKFLSIPNYIIRPTSTMESIKKYLNINDNDLSTNDLEKLTLLEEDGDLDARCG